MKPYNTYEIGSGNKRSKLMCIVNQRAEDPNCTKWFAQVCSLEAKFFINYNPEENCLTMAITVVQSFEQLVYNKLLNLVVDGFMRSD